MADIQTLFHVHETDGIHLTFDDPNFVRANMVVVDNKSGHVQALIDQKLYSLGTATQDILTAFCDKKSVLLSAVRTDGSVLELNAEVVLCH